MKDNMLTELEKQNIVEWYGSCTLSELIYIKERLDFAIQDRIDNGEEIL